MFTYMYLTFEHLRLYRTLFIHDIIIDGDDYEFFFTYCTVFDHEHMYMVRVLDIYQNKKQGLFW